MEQKLKKKPAVLSLSGHDPTGGAGIQADIEAINAHGAHALTIVTCLTRQDTRDVYEIQPVDANLILRQAEAVLADMTVDAIKIGLIGNPENVRTLGKILSWLPQVPVVLDPVLAAGGGMNLSGENMAAAISEILLPATTLVTPNIPEAETLSGAKGVQACAEYFSHCGCGFTLITGTHSHESGSQVTNLLYQQGLLVNASKWPRLAYSYHGSGCTLASSIGALLAHGKTLKQAVLDAQAYTWNSLSTATRQGNDQLIPNR